MVDVNEKVPVFDELAERGAIGAALLDGPRVLSFAKGVLHIGPEAFFIGELGAIFRVAMGLLERGQHVDLLTVCSAIGREFPPDDAERLKALARECVDSAVSPTAGPGYLEIVRAAWVQRAIQREAMQVVEDCYKARGPDDVDAFAARCAERVAGVVAPREREATNDEVMAELEQAWRDAYDWRKGDESKKPAMGIPTPWGWLTETLCGLENGTVLVVGGRPSAGKTTLEDCLVEHALIRDPDAVAVRWTMDSSRRELLARALCRNAGVSMPKMKQGFSRHDQLDAVRAARARVPGGRMRFYEGNDLYAGMAFIRAVAAQSPLRLVTVDYVQQIQLGHERGYRADNENARLTIVSGALKQLCLDLNVPFVVLSQMSRDVEKDDRNEPRLSDLRSSGAIEQDADKVMFLSVDMRKRGEMEAKLPGATKHKRPIRFEVLKNKNGETGWRAMWMFPPYFKFVAAADPKMKEAKGKKGETVCQMDYWPDDDVDEEAMRKAGGWELDG